MSLKCNCINKYILPHPRTIRKKKVSLTAMNNELRTHEKQRLTGDAGNNNKPKQVYMTGCDEYYLEIKNNRQPTSV